MDTTSSTIIKYFAFESYTISGNDAIGDGITNLDGIKLSLVNFWTGDNGVNDRINGEKFPIFLRLFGYLST